MSEGQNAAVARADGVQVEVRPSDHGGQVEAKEGIRQVGAGDPAQQRGWGSPCLV